jgi:HD-GYP domain-containing protein (c-di-GMP phosphodiesterase class II)
VADARTHVTEAVEALHALLTSIVSRAQYPEGHPSIERADEAATATFARALGKLSEIVVALVEGELMINDRPMPELRGRMPGFLDAMSRHGIECLVFLQGIERPEMTTLAESLTAPADPGDPRAARERITSTLGHVLVRFVALRDVERSDYDREEASRREIEPLVVKILEHVTIQIRARGSIDHAFVRGVAASIVEAIDARTFALRTRRFDEGALDLAGHSTNVAVMSAAIAREARLSQAITVEITCAALLHDVGELLLPEALQGVPYPLLDERGQRYARHHPLLGARALLDAGCPALWVATALDHHRGVDGRGYPPLEGSIPHDATRIVSIANYIERTRIPLGDDLASDAPEAAVRGAMALAGRYFDPAWLEVAVRAIGVFSPGTVVELTDGHPAMVTRVNARDPLRPEVRILFGDEAGMRVDLAAWNVRERKFDRSIVRVLLPKAGTRLESRFPPADDERD